MLECPIKSAVKSAAKTMSQKWDDKIDEIWEKGVDYFDAATNKIKDNAPKWANDYVFRIREHGKQIDEMLGEYNRLKSSIYTHAAQVKEYIDNLSSSDNRALFRALDGLDEPEKLPAHVKPLYEKFRKVIDGNAKALVEAGALKDESVIKDYLKRYYTQAIEEKRASASLKHKEFFARKNLSEDERIAIQMIDDAGFVVGNTLAEQRVQLLKAQTLKSFADKFGKDEWFEGAVKISDETGGGGIKRYGALGGKFVSKEVADAIKDAEILGREMSMFNNAYFALIDHIKVNVTVKNPFTHLYNFGSNFMLSFLHGDMKELGQVVSMIDKNGSAELKKLIKVADSLGLGSMLNDLEGLKNLKTNKNESLFVKMAKFLYMAEGSRSGDGARWLYAWEDKLFKLARFKKNLGALAKQKGIKWNEYEKFSPDELKEAMKDAQWGYVDYSTHLNGTFRLLDKSGIMPFLHYTVKSTPMVAKTIMKNPLKFAALQAVMIGAGASAWLGDNERENLAKPEWAESGALANMLGIKSWTRLGNGWYINTGRLMPGMRFDGFDKLEFSGGFVAGAINIASGKSTLGYNLESEDDSWGERIFSRFKELLKSYAPPLTIGRYAQNLGDKGVSDITGADIAPKDYNQDALGYGEILARGAGMREFNAKKEYKKEANKIKKEYASLLPRDVKEIKGKDEEAREKSRRERESAIKHNDRLARRDRQKVSKKKLELEKRFNLIKQTAQNDGVKLDLELLKRGSGSADFKFKLPSFGE